MTASLLATLYPDLFGASRAPRPVGAPPASSGSRSRIQSGQPGRAVPPRLSMRPTIEVDGETVQFLPIGDLARALGRSVSHVRLLEAKGVLPPPHRRRRVAGVVAGVAHPGWRMYRSDYIAELAEIALEEKITKRRAVMDMTTFSERAWAAHRALHATA